MDIKAAWLKVKVWCPKRQSSMALTNDDKDCNWLQIIEKLSVGHDLIARSSTNRIIGLTRKYYNQQLLMTLKSFIYDNTPS